MRGAHKQLIAALSARALAKSAQRAGLSAYVLDVFGDMDTRAASLALEVVGSCRKGFDAERLIRAARRLCPRGADLVYGSGFEYSPDLLARLASCFRLVGNSPEVICLLKDPVEFFGLLKCLGIPHPQTTLMRPEGSSGWLIKRAGAAGGGHVRPVENADPAAKGWYFQRYLQGRTCSLVFLANSREAVMLGYNEQWHANGFPDKRFLYGGAVSVTDIEPYITRAIEEAIVEIVRATGLRGLCGVDFILQGDKFWVLEVNPRPTATFELHERQRLGSLFDAHALACEGKLPLTRDVLPRSGHAHGILYAEAPLCIAVADPWPAWASDRPANGTHISTGEPICTVHARSTSPRQARQTVVNRLRLIRSRLTVHAEVA
ncbi:MAG: ATP-grasp domain-containing protein [Gammaproteobacteria bacterium]|nr:ATP-grasp domain-containing protein [Gammaproteobacteria bacterium]MCI0591646.1 ATP-grasp domain-containing protein [Gammaproteobacteria bacterium]